MEKDKVFTKKILTRIGIALAIIIPLLLGVLYAKSLIRTTSDRIVDSRKQFAEKAASLSALVGLRNQYNSFGRIYLNVLHNVIPIKDELINISKELEAMAIKNNLEFGFSFRGEKNPTDGDLGYIQYSLSVEGSDIDQIQNFIKDLNEFKYINTVDSLSIRREIDNKIEVIDSRIDGRVYFRMENI